MAVHESSTIHTAALVPPGCSSPVSTNETPLEQIQTLDPRRAMRKHAQERKALVPVNDCPLPSRLPRARQVLLHCLQSGFALTPNVIDRWRSYIPKGRSGTHNEDEDTPMHFNHQCPDCCTPCRPMAKHLFWEFQAHEEARGKYLDRMTILNYEA